MSFGELHKIKNMIDKQAEEVQAARHNLHHAKWELVNGESEPGNVLRLVSEALDILTRIAN